MHTFSAERGAVRAISLVSRRALWAGLGLAAASLAVAFAGQTSRARCPSHNRRRHSAATARLGLGSPVNIYAPNNPYAPPREDGEIHARMSAARSGS